MDKVKISKSQANALSCALVDFGGKLDHIVSLHLKVDEEWVNAYEEIGELELDTLIRALYIGYEVEETPEDKVKNYYHSLNRDEDWEPDEYQRACGVVMTLGLLGIKIEGIN